MIEKLEEEKKWSTKSIFGRYCPSHILLKSKSLVQKFS